jgi:hypothetical protein
MVTTPVRPVYERHSCSSGSRATAALRHRIRSPPRHPPRAPDPRATPTCAQRSLGAGGLPSPLRRADRPAGVPLNPQTVPATPRSFTQTFFETRRARCAQCARRSAVPTPPRWSRFGAQRRSKVVVPPFSEANASWQAPNTRGARVPRSGIRRAGCDRSPPPAQHPSGAARRHAAAHEAPGKQSVLRQP